MTAEALRPLFVPMDEIVDALDSHGESPTFYLDTQTGQVELSLDPIETPSSALDPAHTRHAQIPRRDAGDEHRLMQRFVSTVEDDGLRVALEQTLSGKGALRSFREVLQRHPDLSAQWEQHRRDQLVQEAIAWLAQIGIEPQYELRPLPARHPIGRSGQRPGEPRPGLFDLLLLGAPEGKTELIDGRVRRVFQATDPEQAARVFARLARELCEHHAHPWRRPLGEADRFELDRCRLVRSGRQVELSIAVPAAIWQLFSAG
jgi:hypothetical protein